MDAPEDIVEEALELHRRMIRQMKGVPGVQQERVEEGVMPRHCALSLVGEPIMYPEINALVGELHRRRISTFLVTNAQFPERIKALHPITQVGWGGMGWGAPAVERIAYAVCYAKRERRSWSFWWCRCSCT